LGVRGHDPYQLFVLRTCRGGRRDEGQRTRGS